MMQVIGNQWVWTECYGQGIVGLHLFPVMGLFFYANDFSVKGKRL